MTTTDTKFKITAANLEDVPEIVALCYKSYYEIGDILPKPNTEKALSFMVDTVNDGVVLLGKHPETNRIIGVLALVPFEFWWSDEAVIHAVTFYVDPGHRNSTVAKDLLNSAKEYAEINDVRLYVDILTNIDLESKEVFLKREKMNKVGSLFCSI